MKVQNSGFSKGKWEREIMNIGNRVDTAIESKPVDIIVKGNFRDITLTNIVDSLKIYLDTYLTRIADSHQQDVPGTTTDDDCLPIVDTYSQLYQGVYTSGQKHSGLTVELNYSTPFNYSRISEPAIVRLYHLVDSDAASLKLLTQARGKLKILVGQVIQENFRNLLPLLVRDRQVQLDAAKALRHSSW